MNLAMQLPSAGIGWMTGIVACAVFAQQTGLCQERLGDGEARSILRAPISEQTDYALSVLNRGFPDEEGDKFSLLLANRSSLVVPLLQAKALELLLQKPTPDKMIDLISAMIAFAGDEESLKAISRLIRNDESRFGPLVQMTLLHSMNWRNPFTLAYRALAQGDVAVSRRALQWSDEVMTNDRMKRLWAEALVEKYGGTPTQRDWEDDPIASGLGSVRRAELREVVLRFASEVATKRKSPQ